MSEHTEMPLHLFKPFNNFQFEIIVVSAAGVGKA